MQEYVTVKELAKEWGMDKSNARRYLMGAGFSFVHVRTPETRGQKTLALTLVDAEQARQARERDGYSGGVAETRSNGGYFYIVQLVPDLDPKRVKLGFASKIDARLQAHKMAAPTAKLVETWPCKRVWEYAIIDSITRSECKLLSNEVFECENIERLIESTQAFFKLMPEVA